MGELSEPQDVVAQRLRVTGRVQGVGFRWFACEVARRFDVAGWTSNLADGTVLVEASAQRVTMDLFVAALREGPPAAQVAGIIVEPRADGDPLPTPFQIRR
jgi:acylphosphatase